MRLPFCRRAPYPAQRAVLHWCWSLRRSLFDMANLEEINIYTVFVLGILVTC